MKVNKFLHVKMRNGWWKIPAHLIAESRATYYAGREGQQAYFDEYEITMNDDFEILDWAANNMNWSNVAPYAIFVGIEPMSDSEYQKSWSNAEKKVITIG